MKRPISKKPKKQRNFLRKAPLHIRRKIMSSHLSKELRKEYGKRSAPVKKGDQVTIMRGKFKKKSGEVSRVDRKKYRVYVQNVMVKRTDGTERQAPLHPSKLEITKLNTQDKKRVESLKIKAVKKSGEKK